MAFSEATLGVYTLSCVDQVVILKPRQEALMHLYNGVRILASSLAERSVAHLLCP